MVDPAQQLMDDNVAVRCPPPPPKRMPEGPPAHLRVSADDAAPLAGAATAAAAVVEAAAAPGVPVPKAPPVAALPAPAFKNASKAMPRAKGSSQTPAQQAAAVGRRMLHAQESQLMLANASVILGALPTAAPEVPSAVATAQERSAAWTREPVPPVLTEAEEGLMIGRQADAHLLRSPVWQKRRHFLMRRHVG